MQRKFKENDRDYITRTVIHSFLNGSKEAQKIHKDSYMQAHNKTVNGLLDNCFCGIVCDSQDEDLIYGFVIYESLKEYDVLHYLYVRKEFRGKDVAGTMLRNIKSDNNSVAISHQTDDFRPARLKKYWSGKVIYDPYLRGNAYRRLH
jgi:hypothetical protein